MIYPIVKYGQDLLEKVSEPVAEFNGNLEKLVADMFDTMYAANGVGLAAPQIGISKRLAVIDVSNGQDAKAKRNRAGAAPAAGAVRVRPIGLSALPARKRYQ